MKNADEKQVFEVMQVEHISGDVWKVRGRNYKDIRTGDTLYAYMAGSSEALPFEVMEIMAFGKSLPEISYGYASELVIKGDGGKNLSQISHLYRL